MTEDRVASSKVQRLAEDMYNAILKKAGLISAAEGKITFEAFPKGDSYDIKVTVTSR